MDVHTPTWWHETALHHAVTQRQAETVRVLLECGADPQKMDRMHRTPLGLARGFRERLEALARDEEEARLKRQAEAEKKLDPKGRDSETGEQLTGEALKKQETEGLQAIDPMAGMVTTAKDREQAELIYRYITDSMGGEEEMERATVRERAEVKKSLEGLDVFGLKEGEYADDELPPDMRAMAAAGGGGCPM